RRPAHVRPGGGRRPGPGGGVRIRAGGDRGAAGLVPRVGRADPRVRSAAGAARVGLGQVRLPRVARPLRRGRPDPVPRAAEGPVLQPPVVRGEAWLIPGAGPQACGSVGPRPATSRPPWSYSPSWTASRLPGGCSSGGPRCSNRRRRATGPRPRAPARSTCWPSWTAVWSAWRPAGRAQDVLPERGGPPVLVGPGVPPQVRADDGPRRRARPSRRAVGTSPRVHPLVTRSPCAGIIFELAQFVLRAENRSLE